MLDSSSVGRYQVAYTVGYTLVLLLNARHEVIGALSSQADEFNRAFMSFESSRHDLEQALVNKARLKPTGQKIAKSQPPHPIGLSLRPD